MTEIAIRPAPGRVVPLPAGGATLDGLAIVPGGLLPEAGARVELGSYVQRRLDDGDVEAFEAPAAEAAPATGPTEDAA